MSALEHYAKETRETKGLTHQSKLQTLRWYIKQAPITEVRVAIRRMKDIELLKTLWEAGLTNDLQKEVLRRTEELKGRRTTRGRKT